MTSSDVICIPRCLHPQGHRIISNVIHVNRNTTQHTHRAQDHILASSAVCHHGKTRQHHRMAVAHQSVLQNTYDCGIGCNVQGKAGEILPGLLDV